MKIGVLRHPIAAQPAAGDFAIIDAPLPACPPGGVLARVIYVSLDPYVGARLRGRHMGEPAPRPMLDPIPGAIVGRVVESDDAVIAPGAYIHAMEGGWAEMAALPACAARVIDPAIAPLSAHMGVLGMPGLTAWAGITQLAKAEAGDVVLVDAAAGPVGGTAGQLARLKGAKRVVGIAGGADKCRLVVERYGFDACVDYRGAGWPDALDAALGAPVTVHFENVSADLLALGLGRLAPYGRVVLCGLAGHYHADAAPAQVPIGAIIGKRAQVFGLVVYDFYDRWDAFLVEAAPAVRRGALRFVEDRAVGLEGAPALFERLMRGRTVGKALVQVGEEAA